jgi:hypothetical protein
VPSTIGIDLDNTLIRYDRALHSIALDAGLITQEIVQDKTVIRDLVRVLPDGETRWQQLQARLYGPDIGQAELMNGALEFLRQSHALGNEMFIISHKTQFAAADNNGCDLRKAAMNWLQENGVLEQEQTGISSEQVFFADTRAEKLAMIAENHCEVFIDDLLEVLTEQEFPDTVDRILLALEAPAIEGILHCRTWQQVTDYICAAG